jgi:hypothetical protein
MRDGKILRWLTKNLTTRSRLLIDDSHTDAMLAKHSRGGEARRASADDGDLARLVTHLLIVLSHHCPSGTTTRSPARTGVKHARTRDVVSAPSFTSTRQSKQTPMLQKGVRSLPKLSRDVVSTPTAISAVRTDSPSYASIARPLTKILTAAGRATPAVMRLLTLGSLQHSAHVTPTP